MDPLKDSEALSGDSPFQPRRRVEVDEKGDEIEYEDDRDETPKPSI